MALTGYTKLFSSIVTSTIWRAPKDTKIVFITMLAIADRTGRVEGSIPGLADLARVSVSECEQALIELASPDKYSRTKDNEGRRIEPTDGGWILLNHPKYRQMLNTDERREYLRKKKAESRAKRRADGQQSVNNCRGLSTPSTHATTTSDPTTEVRTIDRSTSCTGTDLLLSTAVPLSTETRAAAVQIEAPPRRGHARGPSEPGSLVGDHVQCRVCSTTNRDLCIQYKLYDSLSEILNDADADATKRIIESWLREFEKPYVKGGSSPGGFTWMVKNFRAHLVTIGRTPPEISKPTPQRRSTADIVAGIDAVRQKRAAR